LSNLPSAAYFLISLLRHLFHQLATNFHPGFRSGFFQNLVLFFSNQNIFFLSITISVMSIYLLSNFRKTVEMNGKPPEDYKNNGTTSDLCPFVWKNSTGCTINITNGLHSVK